MADQQVVGKMGRVTGRIGPDRLGEVMISIRGGTESFHAYAVDRTDLIAVGRPDRGGRLPPAPNRDRHRPLAPAIPEKRKNTP